MRYELEEREAGSNLRLIDSCITQLTAQGPSRTCNESEEEEQEERDCTCTRKPVTDESPHTWILCEHRFKLKIIFKAILATLEKISDYSL